MLLACGEVTAKSTQITVCCFQPGDNWDFEWDSSFVGRTLLQNASHAFQSLWGEKHHPTDFQMYPMIPFENHWATYVINTTNLHMQ